MKKYSLPLLALGAGAILSFPLASNPTPARAADLNSAISQNPQEYIQLDKGYFKNGYNGRGRSSGRARSYRRG